MGARGRAKNRGRSVSSAKTLEPPYPLSPNSRKIWDVIVPKLKSAGMLEDVDVYLIITYCDSVATMKDSMVNIKKEGPVLVSDSRYGTIRKKNPWCSVWAEAYKQSASAGKQLGIGFVTRQRAKLGLAPDVDDDMDDLDRQLMGKKSPAARPEADDD